MNALGIWLDRLVLRKPQAAGRLCAFPIAFLSKEFAPQSSSIWTLREAMDKRAVRLIETGAMDTVTARNFAPCVAAVLPGETLIGGAQNRAIAAPAALPPGGETTLPSVCVEVNRWDIPPGREGDVPSDKKGFKGCDIGFAGLRSLLIRQAAASLSAGGPIAIDQREVWRLIVDAFGAAGARSDTLDLHDLYDHWDPLIRGLQDRFFIVPNQVGILACVDGTGWTAELFDAADTLRKHFKQLIKSLLFEALLAEERPKRGERRPSMDDAQNVFKCLKTLRARRAGAAGDRCSTFYVQSPHASGLGTTMDENILTLSVSLN